MSNYTRMCSVDLAPITAEEKTWLMRVFKIIEDKPWDNVSHFGKNEAGVLVGPTDEPLFKEGTLERKISELELLVEDGETDWNFEMTSEGCIYTEGESGNVDALIGMLVLFVQEFRPKSSVGLTWGWVENCDGGGGAAHITARGAKVMEAQSWLDRQGK